MTTKEEEKETTDDYHRWKREVNALVFCACSRRGCPPEITVRLLEWVYGYKYVLRSKAVVLTLEDLVARNTLVVFDTVSATTECADPSAWRLPWLSDRRTSAVRVVTPAKTDRWDTCEKWESIMRGVSKCANRQRQPNLKTAYMHGFLRLARQTSYLAMLNFAVGVANELQHPTYPLDERERWDANMIVVHAREWVIENLPRMRDLVMAEFLACLLSLPDQSTREDYIYSTRWSTFRRAYRRLLQWERFVHPQALAHRSLDAEQNPWAFLWWYGDPAWPYAGRFLDAVCQMSDFQRVACLHFLNSCLGRRFCRKTGVDSLCAWAETRVATGHPVRDVLYTLVCAPDELIAADLLERSRVRRIPTSVDVARVVVQVTNPYAAYACDGGYCH